MVAVLVGGLHTWLFLLCMLNPGHTPGEFQAKMKKSIHQCCAKGSPTNTFKALWCIYVFFTQKKRPLFLVKALEFSELKTPLVYIFPGEFQANSEQAAQTPHTFLNLCNKAPSLDDNKENHGFGVHCQPTMRATCHKFRCFNGPGENIGARKGIPKNLSSQDFGEVQVNFLV